MKSSEAARDAIRVVAIFEAFKGVVVIAAGSGVLLLVHRDLHELAARLVAHAHLNPASKYPAIFIDAVTRLQDMRLTLLALGALAYSTIRFVEAYGLWREKAWAEWLAAVSGAIYVPLEAIELVKHVTALRVSVLLLNLVVVAVMVNALVTRRRQR
jgi:uncharacterized membrane protein (DUF2068 family)